MKLLKLLLVLLILFFNGISFAQSTNTYRINYTTSSGIFPTIGIAGGLAKSHTSGNHIFAGLDASLPTTSSLTEIDAAGAVVWSKRYSGGISYQFSDIKKDPSNGYYTTGSAGNAGIILGLDNNGNTVMGRNFSLNNSTSTYLNKIVKTSDGGYICSGQTKGHIPPGSTVKNDSTSALVVKFDANGSHVWHRVFRFYKNAAQQEAIQNDASFVDVVEVSDGYMFVGRYEVNDVPNSNEDGDDMTPSDAIILKTTKSGDITYLKQLDAPSMSLSQRTKAFRTISKTAAGLPIISGYDGDGRPIMLYRFAGNGGWAAPQWSRRWRAGSHFLFGAEPLEPTSFFETADGNYAVMGFHLKVDLPPNFSQFLYVINPNNNNVLIKKRYEFGMGDVMPIGLQADDGGFVSLSTVMDIGLNPGFKYQIIKTDENGDMHGNCEAKSIDESSGSAANSWYDPYYNSWNNNPYTNADASPNITNITPNADIQCISIVCTPPEVANSVIANPNPICPGGNTTITASGPSDPGVYYEVFSTATGGTTLGTTPLTVSPSSTTTYYVETVDNDDPDCRSATRAPVTVTVSAPPSIVINGVEPSCKDGNDGTATATPSGNAPFTFSWSNGDNTQTATGLSPGTYTVTVTDTDGCEGTQSVTITNPDGINLTASSTTTQCGASNGTATVTATGGAGGYTYLWNDPNNQDTPTATGLAEGTYQVTVTDNNGCEQTANVNINVANGPTVTIINPTDPSCFGGSDGTAEASTSGGSSPYSYSWSPSGGNNAIGTGLQSGVTYTVTVTDNYGCDATATVTLNDPNPVQASTTSTDTPCGVDNGTATVTASGGAGNYTYVWSDPYGQTTQTATGLAAGSYTVTITDANGCTGTATANVNTLDGPSITISNVNNASCYGASDGSASASTTGGVSPYTYSWSPSGGTSATANNLSAGTYTVTVTDANGCEASETIIITQPDEIAASVSSTETSCSSPTGTATVTASGGAGNYIYSWNDSNSQTSATATNLAEGTYQVTITDGNGCSTTAQTTITTADGPSVSTSIISNITCFGETDGSAEATATGGTSPYTYSWSPSGGNSNSINNLSAGEYTVTVTDANGCQATSTVTITEPSSINVTADITDSDCDIENGRIALVTTGGTGNYTYSWTPNGETTSVLDNVPSGTYTVTITDNNGCSTTASYDVNSTGYIEVDLQPEDLTINSGESVGLTVSVNGSVIPSIYTWTPEDDLSCTNCPNPIANPTETTTYTVTVTTDNGCVGSDQITITVKPVCGEVFVPNMFSPNIDGNNDELCVYANCVKDYEFTIYDRWGEKVFTSNSINECWDGRYRGKYMNTGVFVYKLHMTTKEGQTINETGNINLVR